MLNIRNEKSNDASEITRIEYAAFKDHPMHPPGSEPVEQRIVERLREEGALRLSLLAEEDREPVGHIALSPAALGGTAGDWLLLGPVGVLPDRQGRGVGSALVREALDRARESGAAGVVLVGDPAYYGRFGFAVHSGLTYAGVPGEYVLGLSFSDEPPVGAVTAHAAFSMRPE